jgi:Zn-dependent protease with chaperone function
MIRLRSAGRHVRSFGWGVVLQSLLVALAASSGVLLVASAGASVQEPIPQASAQPRAAQPTAAPELEPVAVPEPTAKAMQYYHSGNRLWVINRFWALLIPGILAFSGASARLRNLAQRLGGNWFLTIGLYMLMFLPIVFIIDLPLSFYQGFIRQHAYGLSNQTLAKWLGDALKNLAIDMAACFTLVWIPYLLLARSPRRWWLYTAILWVPFLFVTLLVVPIWIDPLFNHFGPMKNKELERSILDLAARAGIDGSRVFEVDKSVDTNALNAYVKGVTQSKRIVLWDTLIAKLDEPELLVVMGHEMGHYVLGHVVRSIWLSSIITLAGLFLVDRCGRWLLARYRQRLGFESLADVASVPLLIMLLEGAYLVLSPVAFAYSRYQEHEADRYALELTHANHSAATSFVKMQMENLGNPRPGLLYRIFRSTHPSTGERIDFCNTYHPWESQQPSPSGPDLN